MRARSSVIRPWRLICDDLRKEALDPRTSIHRDGHQRQILGQRQYPVGAKPVLDAEALGAAQHDAHLDLPSTVKVEQGVGDELLGGSVALPEIGCELETVRVHR